MLQPGGAFPHLLFSLCSLIYVIPENGPQDPHLSSWERTDTSHALPWAHLGGIRDSDLIAQRRRFRPKNPDETGIIKKF